MCGWVFYTYGPAYAVHTVHTVASASDSIIVSAVFVRLSLVHFNRVRQSSCLCVRAPAGRQCTDRHRRQTARRQINTSDFHIEPQALANFIIYLCGIICCGGYMNKHVMQNSNALQSYLRHTTDRLGSPNKWLSMSFWAIFPRASCSKIRRRHSMSSNDFIIISLLYGRSRDIVCAGESMGIGLAFGARFS